MSATFQNSPTDAVKPKLLIIDDDQAILPMVDRFARQHGFDVYVRSSGREALEELADLRPHVALVNLLMPGLSGIDVLKTVRLRDPDCQVILMTGRVGAETALQAVKAGALDYLSKPFDFERLRELLVGVRDELAQRERLLAVDADIASHIEFQGMIGRSAAMRDLFHAIRRLAPHGRAVLVTGETGSGKELVARALHNVGPRRAKRFLTLNCPAVDEGVLESELFGHVRGAFGGAVDAKVGLLEHAHDGTLLLDEIGELPLSIQPKLLRAIEQGEIQRIGSPETRRVDVRVILATSRDLRADVVSGRLRSDLFHRFSVVELRLPPLRDRREDIPYLTAAFIRAASQRSGRAIAAIAPAAERRLLAAHWPGNVRELRNVIDRACAMRDGATLSERDVQAALTAAGFAAAPARPLTGESPAIAGRAPADTVRDLPDLLTTAQREQIVRVLREENGNKAAAAKRLGVSRRSLYRWIERLDVKI
jgi:DNA-binding NtrC family response regulator